MAGKFLVFVTVNRHNLVIRPNTFHLQHVILSPALSDPLFSQLSKGIDEIGQVINGLSDEDQVKGKYFVWSK